MDGIVDDEENARLTYVDPIPDPVSGSIVKNKKLVQSGEDGPLAVVTSFGFYEIRMAVKESPDLPDRIPSLATLALCVLGFVVIFGRLARTRSSVPKSR